MNCPKCNVPLAMSDRQGVEIDYCPQCRGVWLDRGELDKIIERSYSYDHGYSGHDNHYDKHHDQYKHKKHKSWLHDFFD